VLSILVVGSGGIGAISAAALTRAGHQVTLLARTTEGAKALQHSGITVRAKNTEQHTQVRCMGFAEACSAHSTNYDIALFATQTPELLNAASALKAHLGRDTLVACMSNGLPEGYAARALPDHRIAGAVVSFGAEVLGQGHYRLTATGKIVCGEHIRGSMHLHSTALLQSALNAVAPTGWTTDLRGMRMAKLIVNSAVSAVGTVCGSRLGAALLQTRSRELALAVLGEGVRVATAAQIALGRIGGIDLDVFSREQRRAERGGVAYLRRAALHAALLAFGAHYRHMRSSMLVAILHGKAPAVDFLCGEIVALGKTHGVPTPVNAALQAAIWAIARGDLRAGPAALQYADTLAAQ
jgi:2-dehydropantoate 2-reductase